LQALRFNITDSPTAFWTAQQIVNAFPENTAPKYLIRDRDGIYGKEFVGRVHGLGVQEKTHRSTLALAKSICGEIDWLDPSRVS
jgi:hypothetical protein